jgi:hypothetical protein
MANKDIRIERTSLSPEVDFRFSQNFLALRGESFPENAMAFYAPLFASVMSYLKETPAKEIAFEFALTYFNSATTRLLHKLFGQFNEAAQSAGHVIRVEVVRESDDSMIEEFFNDIVEDYGHLSFAERINA